MTRQRVIISAVIVVVLFIAATFLLLPKKSVHISPAVTATTALKIGNAPLLSDDLDSRSLLAALQESLAYLSRIPTESTFQFGTQIVNAEILRESHIDFKDNLLRLGLNETFFQYIRENFDFHRTTSDKVIFTGYYEPELRASRQRSNKFPVPLYSTPNDLIKIELGDFLNEPPFQDVSLRGRLTKDNRLIPYHTRNDIDANLILTNQNLEIFWVEDLVEAFFLQIQGSGILRLEDGSTVHVNYSEKNGHPYRAIGRFLVERGALTLEEASMQSIKDYLHSNPEVIREVLDYNPSYVFFREVEVGPIGSIGAILTPSRSIATDYRIFPRGALVYLTTEKPLFDEEDAVTGWQPFSRFALNQDTGGAIRGPGRVDLFTGSGAEAGQIAGVMRQPGTFYFLLKKQ